MRCGAKCIGPPATRLTLPIRRAAAFGCRHSAIDFRLSAVPTTDSRWPIAAFRPPILPDPRREARKPTPNDAEMPSHDVRRRLPNDRTVLHQLANRPDSHVSTTQRPNKTPPEVKPRAVGVLRTLFVQSQSMFADAPHNSNSGQSPFSTLDTSFLNCASVRRS
jgi:hypothetical protein